MFVKFWMKIIGRWNLKQRLGEFSMRGVDLIKLNDDGKIIDFEVMIRPANALQAVGMEMGKRLGV